MEVRRIGCARRVTIPLLTNEQAVSLHGRDISLSLITPRGVEVEVNNEIELVGNNIVYHFGALTQEKFGLGVYGFVAYENKGTELQAARDFCDALRLVPRTCQENCCAGDVTVDEDITLEAGNIEVGIDPNTYTKEQINSMLAEKVNRVIGKVLSDNNYTNEEKKRLANAILKNELASWAKMPNKPTYTPEEIGAIALPGIEGESGQVLGLDADGNITWIEAKWGTDSYTKDEMDILLEDKFDKKDIEDYAKNTDIPSMDGVVYAEDYEEIPDSPFVASSDNISYLDSSSHSTGSIGEKVHQLSVSVNGKQDKINDLDNIRNGASKGATSVQPSTLNLYVQKDGSKVLSDNNYSNAEKQKLANAITEHQSLTSYATKQYVQEQLGIIEQQLASL